MKLSGLYANYILFIIIGFLIVLGSLIKILGYYNFSSDWFWALAGAGLVIEGTISFVKQRRFDNKYKVIEKPSEETSK